MTALAPSAHYTGQRGHAYVASRQNDPHCLGYALNFEFFRPWLKSTDIVLDFGCGNGGMLKHLQSCVARAEGLEVNPAAARMARDTGCTIYSRLADIPPDARFDAVVSNHVLEHIRDVPSTLEHLRQHLVPGGLFIAKLPLDDWRNPLQRTWSAGDVDHHLHTWTPRLFANVLFESGYDVRDVRVICSAWHPRLFPLVRLGLSKPAFWAFAALKRRRQLLAIGVRKP